LDDTGVTRSRWGEEVTVTVLHLQGITVEGDAVRVREAGMEDVIEVAVIGICLQVFSSETWPKIAGNEFQSFVVAYLIW